MYIWNSSTGLVLSVVQVFAVWSFVNSYTGVDSGRSKLDAKILQSAILT